MANQVLGFQQPPSLAISEGATTPDPGAAGVFVWSTTLASLVRWNGSAWNAVGPSKLITRFRARDNYPPASGFATIATRNAILLMEANDADLEVVRWVDVIPQGINLASGAKFITHWSAKTATSGNARLGARVAKLTGNDLDSITFEDAVEVTAATNATSGVLTVTEISVTDMGSIAPGNLVLFECYRDATNTGQDNMSGDAQIPFVEVVQIA